MSSFVLWRDNRDKSFPSLNTYCMQPHERPCLPEASEARNRASGRLGRGFHKEKLLGMAKDWTLWSGHCPTLCLEEAGEGWKWTLVPRKEA